MRFGTDDRPSLIHSRIRTPESALPRRIDFTMTDPTAPSFDPSAIARYGRLELVARLIVEGVMSGLHRSPFKGSSVEFAEHRQYGPGDEIRHIDWRAFGKTDRYIVKEYEEETNLRAYLVVDSSGSMGYAGRTHSKFEQARRLAASLAYLMIGQRDAIGLVTFDTAVRAMIPPRSSPGHLTVVCSALERTETGGEARHEHSARGWPKRDSDVNAGSS